ncbi:hypothetical protein [Chlamydiifrater phoenicopteri]|uniref:hypothetical protein n=1 Tax=Chlamydiifrater phoenicopteri TaxID=2681469 RepID=UPI001BCDF4FF|nr:hypothetical protein [Chlamydiifrater phoenicopteri]
MEIAVFVGPSDTLRQPDKCYDRPRVWRKSTFQCINVDPRGLVTEMPLYFFLLQLIPGIGIITGTITLYCAYKNRQTILRESGQKEILDRNVTNNLRLTIVFGILSMLGLSLIAMLVLYAVMLVMIFSLAVELSCYSSIDFFRKLLKLDFSSKLS